MSAVAIVVIGRNEGERLNRCLHSVLDAGTVVYVDSGSTDGSTNLARSLGVDVIDLDISIPFTAARARNAGWRRAVELCPDLEFVQFVDGDCEVDPLWIVIARRELERNPKVVAVCGRRHERFPEASTYNLLCDLEWDTPIGPADSCGGDALFRLTALRDVDGYRDSMIAGEEPELCFRLRKAGGQIVRLDHSMTYHDAALTHFSQWWTRAVRAGHAYAEGDWLTRRDPVGLWRREGRSTGYWGFMLPMVVVYLAWFTSGWSLLLLLGYPVLWVRVFIRARRRWSFRQARLYANSVVVAKFAHLIGMFRFARHLRKGTISPLIEYKAKPAASAAP